MVSPKERVRANIYKTLLEEEKKKSKKVSMFSLSLFMVGVFAGTSYDLIRKNIFSPTQLVALDLKETHRKSEGEFTIEDLFRANEIRMDKNDFNTENLFVSGLQI